MCYSFSLGSKKIGSGKYGHIGPIQNIQQHAFWLFVLHAISLFNCNTIYTMYVINIASHSLEKNKQKSEELFARLTFCSHGLPVMWWSLWLPYHNANTSHKGRRTLHTKLQIVQLFSIHTTTFFHNCNNFFNSFICGQQFLRRFLWKIWSF